MAVTRAPLVSKQRGTERRAEVEISGIITITAAGAVASVSCEAAPNITGTLAKNAGVILKNAAAGRYDIAFLKRYKNIRFNGAWVRKNGAGAFGNTNANACSDRIGAGITTNADATLQAYLASTGADTDLASGDQIAFSYVAQEF